MSDNTLQNTYLRTPDRNLISDLITGKLRPGAIWHKRNYRLKFMMRTALFYSPTRRMLESLALRPDFEQMLKAQITLPSKPHRQYLVRGLNANQRADAVIGHYQFVDSLSSKQLSGALIAGQEKKLVTLTGKDDSQFSLSSSCAGSAEREGESTLWLRDGNQHVLASLTFSVLRAKDQWQLVIGGLQGPRREVPHEVIKQATRACYGLFPKRLLMEFIWQFAARSGISSLYGVSDNGHVFRALRYRLSKGRHFHASYDDFWQSIEGVKDHACRWQLPLQLERKTLESIASKKRAEYRRRFQLLDDMATQIANLA
ncbi:hypothetical protein EDF88_0881 [Buttiauxella sp. BIGb0552]|uniref:VirK/YbjX family protein n=1 Tax=Buttiauxella sp. BIGb0552 TaxID=2485120 RepID=UPI0010662203|nr:VirK/YbjX family protein [Buttiauxella sp. BIGb0552]TDX20665.1 hypothetical protein EDF88_0881 [Buttiauxella sp. BIGb0552]